MGTKTSSGKMKGITPEDQWLTVILESMTASGALKDQQ